MPPPPTGTNPTKVKKQLAKLRADIASRNMNEAQQEGTLERDYPTAERTIIARTLQHNPQWPLVADADEEDDGVIPIAEGRLAELAHEINTRLSKSEKYQTLSNDHRLAAAIQLAEAKKLCEEKRINFRRWAEVSLPKSYHYDTVRKLVGVGTSENPVLALSDLRERNAEANRRNREKNKRKEALFGPLRPVGAEKMSARLRVVSAPAAPEAPAEPEERPGEAVDLRQAEDGLDAVGLFHALGMMDLAQLRALADKAALTLPADEARQHVQTVGIAIGLTMVREDGSAQFHATLDSVLRDFASLPADAKKELVAFGAHAIGAQIELPA